MTLAHFAAGSPLVSLTEHGTEYEPGVCNIGPAEIARRRRTGHIGLIATIALFALLVLLDAPPLLRFIVALPAAVCAAGYLQAALKFCIAFGSLGVFNFAARGTTQHIADRAARARDRMRALHLSVACAVVGVSVGIVAVLLPV